MALTLNMVGGGGGGMSATDAILRVQAPAGSTVTISKGAVSKSDAGHENADDNTVYDYYFIIRQSQFDSVNPWTVTATLGTETTSKNIIINSSDEYNVVLIYKLWLVKDGVLKATFTVNYGAVSENTNFVAYTTNGNTGSIAYLQADVTDYNTYVIDVYDGNGHAWQATASPSIGIAANAPSVNASSGAVSGYSSYTALSVSNDYISEGISSVDISAQTGTKYIAMAVCGTGLWSGQIRIRNLYLAP